MLHLHNIRKYYGKHLVLDIPFLELNRSVYWAKGPNGSGKTTLLRMIAGLLPFEGQITLNNVNLKQKSLEYRTLVSWADAEPQYPAFLTGTELVKFYSSVRNTAPGNSDALIETLGMRDYIGQKVSTYSSGMTKKLSLVLAFTGRVSLVILDEPFITLDSAAVDVVSRLITRAHSESGTMFLVSSHMDLDKDLPDSARELTVRDNGVFA